MTNPFYGPMRDGVAGRFPPGDGNTAVAVLSSVLRFTIWVLVILAVVWAVREILLTVRAPRHPGGPQSPALAELDMRYARGEVPRDEFLQRRADLGGAPPAGPPPPSV
ncbi:MAG: SHOCT domain-containing protein [Candidatus Dormibacteraeota bacterium]|nr:SHOCT domain-containing protein [Candidatus Dormibacteraeota bacterium]